MNVLFAILSALLSIGSFWLMSMAASKVYLFMLGAFFAASALMFAITPKENDNE